MITKTTLLLPGLNPFNCNLLPAVDAPLPQLVQAGNVASAPFAHDHSYSGESGGI